jgi:hypothetical protein
MDGFVKAVGASDMRECRRSRRNIRTDFKDPNPPPNGVADSASNDGTPTHRAWAGHRREPHPGGWLGPNLTVREGRDGSGLLVCRDKEVLKTTP